MAEKNTALTVSKVFVDKGYKWHSVFNKQIYISGTRKLSKHLKKILKRRSVIEPMIGHMKNDGKLGKNYLKGMIRDKINTVLSAVGHNIRLILNTIVFFYLFLMHLLLKNLKIRGTWEPLFILHSQKIVLFRAD
ncbi:MAG: transposase [Proteobacteria bacterium]|nr:transposase [Pseudomonadota bacterium]